MHLGPSAIPPPAPTASPKISPKRKRSDSSSSHTDSPHVAPFAPRLNSITAVPQDVANIPEAGSSSPRTIVAGQLENLQLRGSIPPPEFGARGEVHKRSKTERGDEGFDDIQSGSALSRGGAVRAAPSSTSTSTPTASPPGTLRDLPDEIAETPQHPPGLTTIQPPSARPIHSPSPPRKPRLSPRSSPPPSSDLSTFSLTWHDSEITGHLVSPDDDPDDDGYGINGIGFKPTPAIAYARSQKRRQQVQEWKAREAREARRERSERRGLGSAARGRGPGRSKSFNGGGPGGAEKEVEGDGRRAVRFA